MRETTQPVMDLAGHATILTSPKQGAISASPKPHVRIEVVTYDTMKRADGSEYSCHRGRRVDLSVKAFLRIVKAMRFGHERTELTETLKAAGLWR